MEELFKIRVTIEDAISLNGSTADVCMIAFSGIAEGTYFNGKTIGSGVDTQKCRKGEEAHLSARYMLEGEDWMGQRCRIFIENNGSGSTGYVPKIVTDSKALASLETEPLSAEIEAWEHGVLISILRNKHSVLQ